MNTAEILTTESRKRTFYVVSNILDYIQSLCNSHGILLDESSLKNQFDYSDNFESEFYELDSIFGDSEIDRYHMKFSIKLNSNTIGTMDVKIKDMRTKRTVKRFVAKIDGNNMKLTYNFIDVVVCNAIDFMTKIRNKVAKKNNKYCKVG